ncbi:hypothetical protein [Sorangium sp. So ce128]|uniref:hypothetical protein n=1 Tax=Sorangium sp. So ce128 TaxID=3133281 RepID=UPI003F5F2A2C
MRRPGSDRGAAEGDVVVVKDGTKPPTRDNIKEVIEIKLPPDELEREQRKTYSGVVVIVSAGPFTQRSG